MNRRLFLQSLLATAVLDPDRLLWVPGVKTIFIPPAPGLAFQRDAFAMAIAYLPMPYYYPEHYYLAIIRHPERLVTGQIRT